MHFIVNIDINRYLEQLSCLDTDDKYITFFNKKNYFDFFRRFF